MSKGAPLDPRELASAKLSLVLAAGLDGDLPKLSLRLVNVIVGRHMHADHGGEAWASIKTYCADLSISSERALREALYALVEGDYFRAMHVAGKTTRYQIAEQFFTAEKPRLNKSRGNQSTPAEQEPGAQQTPAQDEPTTPAHGEPDTPAQNTYETPAHGEPTITVYKTPGNDHREMITGKGSREEASLLSSREKTDDASKKKQPRGKKSEIDELFERRFWTIWPNKVGKPAARRAFDKCWQEIDAIVAGVDRYIAAKPPERQWLNPSTFLNQRRWEDEPAQAVVSANGGPSPGRRRSPDDIWEIAGLVDPYKWAGR